MNFKVHRSRAHEQITIALGHVNANVPIRFGPVADLYRKPADRGFQHLDSLCRKPVIVNVL